MTEKYQRNNNWIIVLLDKHHVYLHHRINYTPLQCVFPDTPKSTFPIFNDTGYTITMIEYYSPYGYAEFVVGKDNMNVTYVTADLS